MVKQYDYGENAVQAARSVLIEVCHLLGEYRESVVLVGGWVPTFILPEAKEHHIGSTDVDLALDHLKLQEAGYQKIEKLLLANSYVKDDETEFRFKKIIGNVTVYVDLLAGENSGTGKGRRHQKIQNLKVRKAKGCDLAFEKPLNVTVRGSLPNGDMDEVNIRVASIVSFMVMKGMALAGRLKDKDAYDIYYCVLNYPGGYAGLAREFEGFTDEPLVREGLEKIQKAFSTIGQTGPGQVARSYEVDGEEAEKIRRDAFEKVNAFLNLVLQK